MGSKLSSIITMMVLQAGVTLWLHCPPPGLSEGHVGVVGQLLSRSTELLKVVGEAGQSCLHTAASNEWSPGDLSGVAGSGSSRSLYCKGQGSVYCTGLCFSERVPGCGGSP